MLWASMKFKFILLFMLIFVHFDSFNGKYKKVENLKLISRSFPSKEFEIEEVKRVRS